MHSGGSRIVDANVTLAKMANLATANIIGRNTAGTGVPESLSTLPTGCMPALTGDVTNSAGALATTIAAKAVTLAKMNDLATASIIGRNTAGTGVPEALSTLPTGCMPALTGDVTNSAGSLATTIAAKAVTLAKMADMATASLLGRNTAGTGVPEVLSAATSLALIGAQASNANLTALAGLNGAAANLIPYFNGAGSMSTIGFQPTSPGSWTPTIVGSTTAGTHVYAIQEGWYFFFDQLVFFGGRVQISTKNSSGGAMAGNITINGLPFTAKNTTNQSGGPIIFHDIDDVVFAGFISANISPNGAVLNLAKNTSGLTSTGANITSTDIGANPNFIFSGFYQKA